MHVLRSARSVALVLALATIPSSALALPPVGSVAPALRVSDPDGLTVDLGRLRGKTVVVLYEDRDSGDQNAELKETLLARAKALGPNGDIVGVAVADVSAYDFWPLKGVAKNAVRTKARKLGLPIFCDWSGKFRKLFRMDRQTSNIVVIDPSGKVAFAAAGEIDAKSKRKLLELVGSEASASR
jgi:hypothetical protein